MNVESVTVIQWSTVIGGAIVTTLVACKIWKSYSTKRKTYPQDTVVLHALARGPHAPSTTPYGVKMETYLRMAKITYVNDHDIMKTSKKGKFPWIEYNGEQIADSHFCIEFLNKMFNVRLNDGFTQEQLGIARAFQKMLEEHTYWANAMDRWVHEAGWIAMRNLKIPYLIALIYRRKIKKMAIAQGMGRHNPDEVYHFLDLDFKALSDFLGTKKFLLGDRPCIEDCSVFGMLSQPYWHAFGSPAEETLKKYKNLCDYCERMKDTYWPDWDDCTTRGGTCEATK